MAFSAFPNVDRNYSCANTEPAIFNRTETDTTNSYNTMAYQFTCPISGTYMFSLSIRNDYNITASVNVMVESSTKIRVNCGENDDDRQGSQIQNQSSSSVVTTCNAGQRVWLDVLCYASNIRGVRVSMFSGFLIG